MGCHDVLNYALRARAAMNPTRVARKPDQCHQFGIWQPKNAATMLPQRQSGTPTALQRAVRAREAAKPKKQRRKWNIQPVRLAAADRVAYPPGQRPAPRPRTPAAPSEKTSVPRARTPAADEPKSAPRPRTPAAPSEKKSVARARTPRVTPPKTAITSHAALAAKRARHLAAGDATPAARHEPAPAPAPPKALIPDEQPVRGAAGARAVTPDEGSHQRRDLRAVVYDAEKKTLLWQAPEGVQPVPYGEALTMARPPRYVRAFYDVASGETCWTADERVPAADAADAASEADASDAASDACIDARGTAAAASPAASSEYSEAFETDDDESFAVDDAEVGASCFFDDVCNHGVAEKRRHLALDGGMEEMRRRIERMEVSLREGGIVPA